MQDDSLIELVASSDASLSVPQERARSLYPAATRMMNVDIEFPQNCVRRNAAQEHIQTSSASVSEAYLKASCSKAPSARTLGVVSGRAPSSLQVVALLACSSSSSLGKVEACWPSPPLLQPTEPKRAKSCNFSDHTVDIQAAVEMTVGTKPPS